MNALAWIILIALVGRLVIDLVANLLNLRALTSELPSEFADTFDAAAYAKSQVYTRARTRFGLFEDLYSLTLVLVFWFAGGFQWLDGIVRSWGFGELSGGLLYIGVLFGANTILSLPFSLYSTFVIEERFGFNRMTPRTFSTDFVKGLVLGVVLGGALLTMVLALLIHAGSLGWLYCWIATVAWMMFVQFIAPTYIMPMFNEFKPLEDESLREKIFDFARRASFTVDKIFVIDGSRRSSKANAFFTGFGKHKRIALFDTLLADAEPDGVVAIVGHEIGHYQMNHIPRRIGLDVLLLGVTFFLLGYFLENRLLFDAFGVRETSSYAALVLFSFLYTPLGFVFSLVKQMLSRKHEFEADQYAAERIDDPETLASALKQLSRTNLANLTPHPLSAFLYYSHPPVLDRIEALRAR